MTKTRRVLSGPAMAVLCACLGCAGCSANRQDAVQSYTYEVQVSGETETVKITLDTSAGLELRDDNGGFAIVTEAGTEAVSGSFAAASLFDQRHDQVTGSSQYTVLEDDTTYFIYTCHGTSGWETDCVARPLGAGAAVVFTSLLDSEDAMEIYQQISVSL